MFLFIFISKTSFKRQIGLFCFANRVLNLEQISEQNCQIGADAVIAHVHIIEMTAVGNTFHLVDAANGYQTRLYGRQRLLFETFAVAHPCLFAEKHCENLAEKAFLVTLKQT